MVMEACLYTPAQHEYDAISQTVLGINMLLKLKIDHNGAFCYWKTKTLDPDQRAPEYDPVAGLGDSVVFVFRLYSGFHILMLYRMKLAHVIMDIEVIRLLNCRQDGTLSTLRSSQYSERHE